MKETIDVRKLNLLHHLKNLNSDSLGHEFYHLQVKYNFPGLVKECRTLIKTYSLPNIIDENLNFPKQKWKQLVKKAVRSKSERDIKIECSKYSKLEYLNTETEELKVQDYITVLSLRKARTKFRIRSRRIDVKMNKNLTKSMLMSFGVVTSAKVLTHRHTLSGVLPLLLLERVKICMMMKTWLIILRML